MKENKCYSVFEFTHHADVQIDIFSEKSFKRFIYLFGLYLVENSKRYKKVKRLYQLNFESFICKDFIGTVLVTRTYIVSLHIHSIMLNII